MPKKIIYAEDAIEALTEIESHFVFEDGHDHLLRWAKNTITALPSAQPERKRGKWIGHKLQHGLDSIDEDTCSECGERFYQIAETGCAWNFCPNCGTDMRGGDE